MRYAIFYENRNIFCNWFYFMWLPSCLHKKRSFLHQRTGDSSWIRIFYATKLEGCLRFFKSYSYCDDGAIWEGYSASVERLLTGHWNKIDELNALIEVDPIFLDFVLRHIDGLMALESVNTVKINTIENCPRGIDQLCRAIRTRLDETEP